MSIFCKSVLHNNLVIYFYLILQQENMFIPIIEWNELEELEELDKLICDSSCSCTKIDPNTNPIGASICTDCKYHLSTRNITPKIWTDSVVLYGALSAAIMAIIFLATK